MKSRFTLIVFLLMAGLFLGGCYPEDGESIEFRSGTYIGELNNGKPHGEGTAYYETGIIAYEGEFEDGEPHGYGKVYYRNGSLGYEGEIQNDLRHGEGTLYYESGSIWYEGGWKEDKFHGFGIEYFDEGVIWGEGKDDSEESPYENETIKYKGEWEDGIKKEEVINKIDNMDSTEIDYDL